MTLIATEWLENHLTDPGMRLLDASIFPPNIARDPRAEYRQQHIPGAVFFDLDAIKDTSTHLPHMLPPPEEFAAAAGALGLGSDYHIVCYDSFGIFGAARAWWMFRAMGHDRVSVLNGGLPKWRAEGRPVTSEIPTPQPSVFTPRFRPELVRDRTGLTGPLADARSPGRFAGTEPEPWPGRRQGHIPGACNVPFTDLINPDKTLCSPDEIRARFAAAGLDPATEKPTCYCGSGVTAAVLALALYTIGCEVPVYDGSWAEWGLPDGGAVATLESA